MSNANKVYLEAASKMREAFVAEAGEFVPQPHRHPGPVAGCHECQSEALGLDRGIQSEADRRAKLVDSILPHVQFDDGEGNTDASVLRGRLACIKDIILGEQ